MKINNLFLKKEKAKQIASKNREKLIEKALRIEKRGKKVDALIKKRIGRRKASITKKLENAEQLRTRIETARESARKIMIEYKIPRRHWLEIEKKVEFWARHDYTGEKKRQQIVLDELSRDIGLIMRNEIKGRAFIRYLEWATEVNWDKVRQQL